MLVYLVINYFKIISKIEKIKDKTPVQTSFGQLCASFTYSYQFSNPPGFVS